MKRVLLNIIILRALPFSIAAFFISACGDMVADEDHVEDLMHQYGHEYEVWADNGFGGPPADCLDPGTSGFYQMGNGYHSQYFDYIPTASTYFVILTRPDNFAFVDAVQDVTGDFHPTLYSCNTNDEGNISDNSSEPDGEFAWVGSDHARGYSGSVVIQTSSNTALQVHIADYAYYFYD